MFKNMKTAKKLMLSFSIVTMLSLVLAGVGIYSIGVINGNYSYLLETPVEQEGLLHEMKLQFTFIRFRGANFCMEVENPEIITGTLTPQFEGAYSTFNELMKEYVALNENDSRHSREEIRLKNDEAAKLQSLVDGFKREVDKVREIALAGDAAEATATLRSTISVANEINATLDSMIEIASEEVHEDSEEMSNAAGMSIIILIAVSLACAGISAAFAMYISNIISRPLKTLEEWYAMTANGDIVFKPDEIKVLEIHGARNDEIGGLYRAYKSLIDSLNEICSDLSSVAEGNLNFTIIPRSEHDLFMHTLVKMMEKLNEMFGRISLSTTQVSSGSRQIAGGAQSLAQGSTQQAASVEELSSSIFEIADKTKTNAEMANKAADLAGKIKESAEEGNRHMNAMTDAVREINEASQQIGKVIKTIDDIAFQTNILALNAAVEAARAGAAGKGFAVVAEEVRNLASKSAEAAKDTADLIANSMEKAELGSRIAAETAESLAEIVQGINVSSQLIGEIASLSQEQSAGIAHINIGIEQVSQVVQQNSATAEESAAAAEEMSGQSSLLEDLLRQFKLK
ncbi:MAG: methyl-accepting chemotaxis protein [Oscillospiraceae bacterium]|nr:methyl-accepting chemotaxis protein [Oscillospiraceae bacterium]